MRIISKNINTVNAFSKLEKQVTNSAKQRKAIDPSEFSAKLHDIGETYVSSNNLTNFNRISSRLAENLVSIGEGSLAGAVYSLLIKLNQKNTEAIEKFATNALAIAKRFHDPVHIMARANDLKEIYKVTQPNSDKHLKTLQTEKRALKEICEKYTKVQGRFHTIKRAMKPVEGYELKLAAIRYEIAQILKDSNKQLAMEELEKADAIMQKHDKGGLYKKIQRLLEELKK